MGLCKSHYNDAVAIAAQGEKLDICEVGGYLVRRLVSKGDYQQTKGVGSEKIIPTGKLFGLRKFDYISTSKGAGFVKGKRSTGHFALADVFGETLFSSVNVKRDCCRIAARKLVILSLEPYGTL